MNVIHPQPLPTSSKREEYIQRVTSKGQVTIPAHLRNSIGVKPNSQVIITQQEGKVVIAPVSMTLDDAFGSVKSINTPENFKKLKETAMMEKEEKLSKTENGNRSLRHSGK